MGKRLLDLTMPFSEKTIPVPGHPCPRLEPLTTLERDGVRNTTMTFSIHTGTHIDAPSHFIKDGATIDEVPIERFRRPGVRLDLRELAEPGAPISLEHLEKAGFDPSEVEGAILMLATGWSDQAWESEKLYGANPYLARDAASALAEASPSALGLDFAVDDTKPWPNHTILLGADVLLIENLMRLPDLPRDGFEVTAFPLRLVGENGGPTRVVAELGR
ncbi:putative cyclase [Rubrobacter xylanophilus DSM 9941]|uniref:Putative cyclase n=1 Tax=Rubrobacter xylanophilus (strain DSM 9941 / JCM 11954 / NBRC 16129 / PRD-1) TaxID=266117 RepID=Q1AUV8_RUBXD|nr:cyclase family protein [Rubrobacter xylanophilus]ABG04820.1 putative cyclase [Rubrobacter xylanophilus DSM 9941]